MKPIIRWLGGKTQLLPEIRSRLPLQYQRYYEPFLGGGAVVFDLLPDQAVVSDKNDELINLYNQLKTNWQGVCNLAATFSNDAITYYQIRAWDRQPDFKQEDAAKRAARFLYLSKTSFNGLWRTNSKMGYHNAAYGKRKTYTIDPVVLKDFSDRIQTITFTTDDFETIIKLADKDDFVYLDPPYIPISTTAHFTSYTVGGFTDADQVRLRDCCQSLHDRGGKFLLSNSDCSRTHQLYSQFSIETVSAKRLVSCKGTARGNVSEVLIRNY